MASFLRLPLLLVVVATLATTQCSAQAPTPPPGPANLTAILIKGGQFTYFLRLLNVTQVSIQITGQLNNSFDGMTVFAPTDNAFQNLKSGLINDLSMEEQVQLVLGHVLPKFYSFDDIQTVSNPVRTEGSSSEGENFGLKIVPTGNKQFNVSSGVVTTQVNNALREAKPLAVYQVDKVLLPKPLFGAKSPKSAPAPGSPKSSAAKAESPSKAAASADAKAPNAAYGFKSLSIGVVASIGLLTTAFLF